MYMMKVAKFGGSSVADAEQLKKVATIIQADEKRRVIVVSAPGKRHADDVKVTDLLIELGESYQEKQNYDNELAKVIARFQSIVKDLALSNQVITQMESRVNEIFQSDGDLNFKFDAIKAIGEDTLAQILSEYLQSLGVNARYLNPKDAGLILSEQPGGAQILEESFAKIYRLREYEEILIIPGFFGYTSTGKLVTFSR